MIYQFLIVESSAGSTLGTSFCPIGTAMASEPPQIQQLPTAAQR